jgi:hypothetical protein
MPRIRITGLPKMVIGGTPPNCDPGYIPVGDKCIPDKISLPENDYSLYNKKDPFTITGENKNPFGINKNGFFAQTQCDDPTYKYDFILGKCVPDPDKTITLPKTKLVDGNLQADGNFTIPKPGSDFKQAIGGCPDGKEKNLVTGECQDIQPKQKKQKKDKPGTWMERTSKNILGTALIAQPIIDYFTDRKQQKKFNKWWAETKLLDNSLTAKEPDKGDVFGLTGEYKPDKRGFKSKGMYTNPIFQPSNVVKHGGTPITSNMKKIKIRIIDDGLNQMNFGGINSVDDISQLEEYNKNLEQFRPRDPNEGLRTNLLNAYDLMRNINKPGYGMFEDYYRKKYNPYGMTQQPGNKKQGWFFATGGQPMTYSGQLGYGLNLGQKRIYTDMPPEKSETLSKTLKPVPRSKANIEAEKDETIFGDVDGDGALEHMLIGGKRHTEGGTPLNVPEGSFIFSDTEKLRIKDEKILKMFGMPPSKKGYTPAEIAKKYDINKYKAVIEDKNADELKKSTAQLMVKTYQKKLAQLALIQEQMKGFPQGIPDVVKNIMPELAEMEGPSKEVVNQEDNQQAPMAPSQEQQMGQEPPMRRGGSVSRLGMYIRGGLTVVDPTTTQAPGYYDQSKTPDKKASLKDPKYAKMQELLAKKAKAEGGKYYVSNLTEDEANELAALITYFGLQHDDETDDKGTPIKGYQITQNSTEGLTWVQKDAKGQDEKVGFFGGVTPQMFENKVLRALYPDPNTLKGMSDIQKRRIFFKNLLIDHTKYTDEQLKDVKKLYTDPDFFNNVFYPAFAKTFEASDYRKEMKDDKKIGLEHLDQFKYQPPAITTNTQAKQYVCTDQGPAVYNAATHTGLTVYSSYAEAQKACYKGAGTFDGKNIQMPFQYMTPDLVTMAAAAAVPPRKYFPWSQQLPFEPADLVLEDWKARAHQRQSQMNKMWEILNTYSPSSAVGANLANLQAQQAEGVVSDIAEIDSKNVAIAKEFAQNEAQRRERNTAANIGRSQELWDKNVLLNQNYDNARRAYLNTNAKAFGQAWKNRMYLGLLNNVNQMYPVDPLTGRSYYNEYAGQDWDDFGASSGSYTLEGFSKLKGDLMERGLSDKKAEEEAWNMINNSDKKDKDSRRRQILSDYQGLMG